MKTSLKLLVSPVLIIALAVLGSPEQTHARPRLTNSSFTGEQIFRGLFFGEAPVAQLFPEIWTNDRVKMSLSTKERVLEFNQMKEATLQWVKTSDPSLMERFGREMQSGDHLRIQTMMQEAGQKISTAIQSLGYGTPGDFSRDCADLVIVFYAFAVLIAAVLAIAYNVYDVKSERGPIIPSPGLEGSESKLYNDMIVNAIAERLDSSKENVPMVPILLPQ